MRANGWICTVLAVASGAVVGNALAQAYPSKPVKLIVPLGVGAPPDVSARLLGQKMAESLGQPVVVENRSGAGGTVGGLAAAKSPADGYTLLMGSSSSLAIGPILFRGAYVPMTAFAPVSSVANQPFIIAVAAAMKADTLQQFVAAVKASPGKFNYASPQNGSPPHMSAELLSRATGISMVHVPFGSIPKAVLALVAGDASLYIEVVPVFIGQIRSGTIKALATAGAKRSPFLPEVPTAAEAGLPDFEIGSWSGLVAPAGTPRPIVARLNQEVHKAAATREVVEGFAKQLAEILVGTPEDLGRHIARENEKWSKLIAEAGIKPD